MLIIDWSIDNTTDVLDDIICSSSFSLSSNELSMYVLLYHETEIKIACFKMK